MAATHTCRRCGFTATPTRRTPALAGAARPAPAGWLDIAWPAPRGRIIVGELCPACVAAVAAFILPPKES